MSLGGHQPIADRCPRYEPLYEAGIETRMENRGEGWAMKISRFLDDGKSAAVHLWCAPKAGRRPL
jgi:hypothetical protein